MKKIDIDEILNSENPEEVFSDLGTEEAKFCLENSDGDQFHDILNMICVLEKDGQEFDDAFKECNFTPERISVLIKNKNYATLYSSFNSYYSFISGLNNFDKNINEYNYLIFTNYVDRHNIFDECFFKKLEDLKEHRTIFLNIFKSGKKLNLGSYSSEMAFVRYLKSYFTQVDKIDFTSNVNVNYNFTNISYRLYLEIVKRTGRVPNLDASNLTSLLQKIYEDESGHRYLDFIIQNIEAIHKQAPKDNSAASSVITKIFCQFNSEVSRMLSYDFGYKNRFILQNNILNLSEISLDKKLEYNLISVSDFTEEQLTKFVNSKSTMVGSEKFYEAAKKHLNIKESNKEMATPIVKEAEKSIDEKVKDLLKLEISSLGNELESLYHSDDKDRVLFSKCLEKMKDSAFDDFISSFDYTNEGVFQSLIKSIKLNKSKITSMINDSLFSESFDNFEEYINYIKSLNGYTLSLDKEIFEQELSGDNNTHFFDISDENYFYGYLGLLNDHKKIFKDYIKNCADDSPAYSDLYNLINYLDENFSDGEKLELNFDYNDSDIDFDLTEPEALGQILCLEIIKSQKKYFLSSTDLQYLLDYVTVNSIKNKDYLDFIVYNYVNIKINVDHITLEKFLKAHLKQVINEVNLMEADENSKAIITDLVNFELAKLSDFDGLNYERLDIDDFSAGTLEEYVKSTPKEDCNKFHSKVKELLAKNKEEVKKDMESNKPKTNIKEESISLTPHKDWFKERMLEGAYQGVAKQAVEKCIDLILLSLPESHKESAKLFLQTEIGFAMVSGLIGAGIHFAPIDAFKNDKVQKIGDKCVENSAASGVSTIIDTVVKFILPSVETMTKQFRVESLPELKETSITESDEEAFMNEASKSAKVR